MVSKQDWKAFGSPYQTIATHFLLKFMLQLPLQLSHKKSLLPSKDSLLSTHQCNACYCGIKQVCEWVLLSVWKKKLPSFSLSKIWAAHAPIVYIALALSNFISILSPYSSKLWLHCSIAFHNDRRNSTLNAKKQELSLMWPAHKAEKIWK